MSTFTLVLKVIVDIVVFLSLILMYVACLSARRLCKDTMEENRLLMEKAEDERKAERHYMNQLCKDLNRVSETILTKLPKAIDSYKVSLEMKKAIAMYLAYFREYDEDYHWDITKVKPFTQDTTVAKEAKILLTHIREGSYNDEKDRVLQAIAYLLLKT